MIGSVATSRRANAFAQSLDEQLLDGTRAADQTSGEASPGPEGAGDTEGSGDSPASSPSRPDDDAAAGERAEAGADLGGPLLALARRLAELPGPELDPEVKTVQRAQLMAAMKAAFAEGTENGTHRVPAQGRTEDGGGTHRAPLGYRPASRFAKRLTAGGLGVGVAASALGGAAAAGDSLPGESLYGVKRSMEDLRLDITGGEADRGRLHLDHAATRLQEARRLMERARAGDLDTESLDEMRRALSAMRHDAAEGHRLLRAAYTHEGDIATMRSLSTFSTSNRASWSHLRSRLPVQLGEVRDEVNAMFEAMESDVRPLSDLLNESPTKTGSRTGGDSDEQSVPARPASPSPEHGTAPGTGHSGSPAPSEKGRGQEGLLGGSLLDPPSGSDHERNDSGPSESPGGELTLPPLVPEVLPEIDNLSGDEETSQGTDDVSAQALPS